jgi:hypothetical protein
MQQPLTNRLAFGRPRSPPIRAALLEKVSCAGESFAVILRLSRI